MSGEIVMSVIEDMAQVFNIKNCPPHCRTSDILGYHPLNNTMKNNSDATDFPDDS